MYPEEPRQSVGRTGQGVMLSTKPRRYEAAVRRKDGINVVIDVSASRTVWHGQSVGLFILRGLKKKTMSPTECLLPICSHCKKIRDQSGVWQVIEGYFQEHSDITFTHGLCPDCMPEYFPEQP